jgi:hypothetical protein
MDHLMPISICAKLYGFILLVVAVVMSILFRKVVISPATPWKIDCDGFDNGSDFPLMTDTSVIILTVGTTYLIRYNRQTRYNPQDR